MKFRGETSRCQSCHGIYEASDLDRYLWCPDCRRSMNRRAAIWGRASGLAAATGVALYVAVVVDPGRRYLILYAAVLAVTYVLVGRIVDNLVKGYYRARGRADPDSA